VILRVTPCENCAARKVCRLTDSLDKVTTALASFMWFFKEGEAHLSFNCNYYIPKAEVVVK